MIDKLFLSRLYYSTKNGKASSQFNEGSHEFYANRLLNNYIALLKDSASQDKENKNRTAHSNHASIDGDTKQIKDIVKDLEESKAKDKLEPFTPYSLWANASTKTEFITGKFGIGPFALNNNSQILTMLYGVKFVEDGFLGELGMNRLDLSQDRYGGSILSWISGLINAHVDVAKDPYISRLNVNSYTYNIVNLMIRTGFGKDTFYFTTQPIMKMMAIAYNNAASQFGSELSRSKARRQRDAVDKAVFDYLKSNFVLPSDVTSLKLAEKVMDGYFKKTRGIEVSMAIKELLAKDNDILHQIAKQGEAVNDAHERWNIGGVMMSTKEVQYLVYRAKQEFQPYERDLADLVKYSKIDTSKQGKNIVEQQAYRDGVKNLFENQRGAGLFEGSGISKYYAKSYIQKKTTNALDLFKDIMASFTIESTGQFRAQMNLIMFMLGETNPTADMYKAVSRQIMNYIRAGFFNKWAEENGIDVKGLVTGSNTIADRLDAIRLAIMTDPAYADMRAGDGSIKNYLLSALVHGFSWRENIADTNFNVGTQKSTHDNVKFIKTLNFMDEDQINDDDMAEAWDELLNDDTHEDIQKFAKDLIMYAFITSGGNTGANLFKYIPNSWKLDSYQDGHAENGFAQYMQDQLEMYQNESDQMISIDPEEIILNNWHDNKFIPVVDITEGYNKYYSGRHWADTTSRPEVAIPVILVKQDTDKATDDRYIKVRRTGANPHSSRNYTIYKAVAYTTSDKLIYVMVDPKGNSFPGNTLYEMRRSDTVVRESSSIAKRGKKGFADFIRAASGTIDIENVSIADVINNFIDTVRAKDDIGKRAALIEMFIQDKELRDILEDAVNTTVAAQGEVEGPNEAPPIVSEIEEPESPAPSREEAENTGARTYKPEDGPNDDILNYIGGYEERKNTSLILPIIEHLRHIGFHVFGKDGILKYLEYSGQKGLLLFIGKRSRSEFIKYLSKRRPDLLSPESVRLNGITFYIDPFGEGEYGISASRSYAVFNENSKQFIEQVNSFLEAGLVREISQDYYVLTEKGIDSGLKYTKMDSQLEFLDSLEDNKENTAYIKTAIRWIANKSITLPEDNEKARLAFDLARNRHVDVQKYNTLGELLASPEMQLKKKDKPLFNPDKAKTFSNKRTIVTIGGRTFIVYDVEDSQEGQKDVCKALFANYNSSPWCLSTFTSTGEPTNSAKTYWAQYNKIPRKIAFEDGKPVAFCSDGEQDLPAVLGRIGNAEFIRISFTDSYLYNPDELSKEDKSKLISDGLAYETDDARNLVLTEKGLNVAQFESDVYDKDDSNRELWWDMDDSSHEHLDDSILNVEMLQRGIGILHTAEDFIGDNNIQQFFKTEDGEIYGFIDSNGNIYLDEEIISPEHIMHEYTHVWDIVVSRKNPKLWLRGVRLMKQTLLWNQIVNDPNYGEKWKTDSLMTDSKFEYLVASEVHSRLVGKDSVDIFAQLAKNGRNALIDRLKQWLLSTWRYLANTFGNPTELFLNKLTLDEFNTMVVRDFAYGVKLLDRNDNSTESNNLSPETFNDDRPYDSRYKTDALRYLTGVFKNYLLKISKNANIISYYTTASIRNATIEQIKKAIINTGGYINDFNIKFDKGVYKITPKGEDGLLIDTLASLRKTLNC